MAPSAVHRRFAPFDLEFLLKTIFAPKSQERVCLLIDLENPKNRAHDKFLQDKKNEVQNYGYHIFYEGLQKGILQKLGLAACDLFAYKKTGGSNLELPDEVIDVDGKSLSLQKDIYPNYQLILCLTDFSATAPLTAAAKKFGFRGATLHGLNEIVVKTGLSVDYKEVSKETEKLRQGMNQADSVDIDFKVDQKDYHLHIELGKQEAQKSHGICHTGGDIVNLPAGEIYFVPKNANGSFPIKLEEDGTLALLDVKDGRVYKASLIRGNKERVEAYQKRLDSDPATGILGELGFGTQVLPYSKRDIQDEKIFGTFHLATGRNDHLNGTVTLDRFQRATNASHDDILFSSTKTPEIEVKQVRMHRKGQTHSLIENYEPCSYLLNLIE